MPSVLLGKIDGLKSHGLRYTSEQWLFVRMLETVVRFERPIECMQGSSRLLLQSNELGARSKPTDSAAERGETTDLDVPFELPNWLN